MIRTDDGVAIMWGNLSLCGSPTHECSNHEQAGTGAFEFTHTKQSEFVTFEGSSATGEARLVPCVDSSQRASIYVNDAVDDYS
jgi:hypothetical protein